MLGSARRLCRLKRSAPRGSAARRVEIDLGDRIGLTDGALVSACGDVLLTLVHSSSVESRARNMPILLYPLDFAFIKGQTRVRVIRIRKSIEEERYLDYLNDLSVSKVKKQLARDL